MAFQNCLHLSSSCLVVLVLLTSTIETRQSKDLHTFPASNQSLENSSYRKGKFFFDELFGLNAGVGLSNDEDDEEEDEVENNVKTCNCGVYEII